MPDTPVDELSGLELRHAVATEVYGWQPTHDGVLGQMRYYTDRDEPQPEDCPLFELSVRQARKARAKAVGRGPIRHSVTVGKAGSLPSEQEAATALCRTAVRIARAGDRYAASV